MTLPSDKVYLGDAVYVTFDGYHVVLTTEDGIRTTNSIYLEPEVLANFTEWLAVMKERASANRVD